MAGSSSLQKHEKDLKTLEQQIEEIQKIASHSHEENQLQISNLTAQVMGMSKQLTDFSSLLVDHESKQAKVERDDLTGQIQSLLEVVKVQSACIQLLVQNQVTHSVNNNPAITTTVSTPTGLPILSQDNAFDHHNLVETLPPPILHTTPMFINHSNTKDKGLVTSSPSHHNISLANISMKHICDSNPNHYPPGFQPTTQNITATPQGVQGAHTAGCHNATDKMAEDDPKLMRQMYKFPIKKLFQYPDNPKLDCFLMTCVKPPAVPGEHKISPFSSKKTIEQEMMMMSKPSTPMPCLVDNPNFRMEPQLFVSISEFEDACVFYGTVFGARILFGEEYVSGDGVEVLIGSNSFRICTLQSNATTGVFSLKIDDVHSCVEKAVAMGAVQLGNIIKVYSSCYIWCTLAGVKDPYGNIWFIYSKLCPSCCKTFLQMF